MTKTKPKTGLVLSSGAARSFFQVGFLDALEDKVTFDLIAATGMGAYFGAMVAAGVPIHKIRKLTESFSIRDFISPNTKNDLALFSNDKFLQKLVDSIGDPQFSDLPHEFFVVTTDLENNLEVILSEGSVISAVAASMALPGFHQPMNLNGFYLTDGSIINPLPLELARNHGCEFTLAIDTSSQHIRKFQSKRNLLTFWIRHAWVAFPTLWLLHKRKIPWIGLRMLEAAYSNKIDRIIERFPPNLLVRLEEIPALGQETLMDSFQRKGDLIKAGFKKGKVILPTILEEIRKLKE